MKINTTNEVRLQAHELQNRLANPEFTLPIFARLRLNSTTVLIPVRSISPAENGITLMFDEGEHSATHFYCLDELEGIEVFCDAMRKPVFLHDFDAKGHFGDEEGSSESSLAFEERKELRAVYESFA